MAFTCSSNPIIQRIGLLAGEGDLPVVFAREASRRGAEVVACAVRGHVSEHLGRHVAALHLFEWRELSAVPRTLKREGVRRTVMLGKVSKPLLFDQEHALIKNAKLFSLSVNDMSDYALLKGVAAVFAAMGVRVVSPTAFLGHLVPKKGILTRRKPTPEEERDIRFGRSVAKNLSRFDIGQTVCVKNHVVLAVEGPEGTDETIRRAAAFVKTGLVAVKVARPNQDMRFDVPLVGIQTIEELIRAKAAVLALEKNKTILLEKEKIVAMANDAGMSVAVID